MNWIFFVKTDPPEWIRHDPMIKNKNDSTIMMIWIFKISTENIDELINNC